MAARWPDETVPLKMPGAPVTSWLTLLFLVSVLVMMAFDYPNGTLTVAALPVVAILLVGGWYLLRRPKAVMMTPTMPSVTPTRKFLE
jgi:L-asparagine permease